MANEFTTSKRDILIAEYLRTHGTYSIEDATDEQLEAADQILGKGNEN